MSYQERLALAMSESELYKSATDLARAMGCTPQAVSLVLSGASKSFGATNHSKASDLLNILPTWLASGEGSMRGTSHTPQQGTESPVGDPVLDDLNVLEPEDADVWRAQIRAAATKIKREKSKQLTETSDFAPKPPQREQQQEHTPQAVDLEIEAAVPQVKP